jgi:hypothetical protein
MKLRSSEWSWMCIHRIRLLDIRLMINNLFSSKSNLVINWSQVCKILTASKSVPNGEYFKRRPKSAAAPVPFWQSPATARRPTSERLRRALHRHRYRPAIERLRGSRFRLRAGDRRGSCQPPSLRLPARRAKRHELAFGRYTRSTVPPKCYSCTKSLPWPRPGPQS